jgi:hypothetical protein
MALTRSSTQPWAWVTTMDGYCWRLRRRPRSGTASPCAGTAASARVCGRAAFEALVALFARLGHLEPTSRLPKVRLKRGARLEAFRGVPPELPAAADAFLAGDSTDLLALLFDRLLESSRARRQAADVEEELRTLDNFVRKDVAPLRHALRTMGRSGCVPGDERDALIIAARHR